MEDKQYDADAFILTTKILQWNPDYYTIWNYRRILILDQVSKDAEKEQKLYQNELVFFLQLIKINPKSYWLWNHRIWCLQTMPQPDWKAELGLVDKMLTMDARNCKYKYLVCAQTLNIKLLLVHGWDYRRFVVSHLVKKAQDETKIADIVKQEYEFTTRKINQSFSNYSAWHQRSKLLPDIVASMSTEEKDKVAVNGRL